MPTATRCKCARCTCRALMGPAVLITIGVLFLLGQVHSDLGFFEKTWPILLLVIGAIKLAEALASPEGHVSS
jgi:cell wall-active antibiotic response 4TMS protein YvqF